MSELLQLAERIEALTEDDQMTRLIEAHTGTIWQDAFSAWARWLALAEVGAWLDAAMTMVSNTSLLNIAGPSGTTYVVNIDGEVGIARTLPLAICSAALRVINQRIH